MRVEKIKDIQITDDGNSIEIAFQGLSTIKLQLTFELGQELISRSIQALAGCRANRSMPAHLPRRQRDIILVEGLELNLYPDHAMDLLVETEHKEHIQVSLTNEQGAALRGILLEGDGKRPPIQMPDLPIQ